MIMSEKKTVLTALKVGSALFIVFILLLYSCIFYSTGKQLDMLKAVQAVRGHVNMIGYDRQNDPPMRLDGEWGFLPDVAFTEAALQKDGMPVAEQLITLPIGSISDSSGLATYTLRLKIDDYTHNYVLYLPYLDNPVEVFVNGVLCKSMSTGTWAELHPFQSTYFIGQFNASMGEQELVICANFAPGDTALFQRPVILGSIENVISYSQLTSTCDLFTFGTIAIIMISAFIYMFFTPGHTLMTLITIFDTILMFRVLFALDSITDFIRNIFPRLVFSDAMLVSIQIFALLSGGVAGTILAHHLLDPHDCLPKILRWILPLPFGILLFILPFRLDLFDRFGVPVMLIALCLIFVFVILQIRVYWRDHKTFYDVFQVFKTLLIGVVLFLDIFTFNCSNSFLPFTFFYLLFFLAHITIRQYDSNLNYRNVDLLNQNLESTVAARTQELETANRVLSELTVRDPLTHAYNRLYLERILEQCIPEAVQDDEAFYCCMFDLDHFKKINDTYGHDAGDQQLVDAVKTVNELISANCILTRVGGEEFVLLFFGQTGDEVLALVENIRREFEVRARSNPKRTTASFGLIRFQPGMQMKDLMKRTDIFLYNAKKNGRNRVECDYFHSTEQS